MSGRMKGLTGNVKIEALIRAVHLYLLELDNPAPDVVMRLSLRKAMREAFISAAESGDYLDPNWLNYHIRMLKEKVG